MLSCLGSKYLKSPVNHENWKKIYVSIYLKCYLYSALYDCLFIAMKVRQNHEKAGPMVYIPSH